MKKKKWNNNYEYVDNMARAQIAADIGEGNIEGITPTEDGRRVAWQINVNVFYLDPAAAAIEKAVAASIAEFQEIFEDVTTSDLQAIVDVRAAEITKTKLYSDAARDVAEKILAGIYAAVEEAQP